MLLYPAVWLLMCVLPQQASSSPPAPRGVSSSPPAPRGVREERNASSVVFVSPPEDLADDSLVRLHSRCSSPCRLTLELTVSTSTHARLPVFRKTWTTGNRNGSAGTHRTRLRLPPSLAFGRGFFNRHVLEARSAVLHAWLAAFNDTAESGSYHRSLARATVALRVTPSSHRPPRPPTGCPSWSAQWLWTTTAPTHQCPRGAGADVEHLLRFPAVSTGERFGVVRTFDRFTSADLEVHRLHAVTQPRLTVSVWIYLLEWCRSKLCGVLLHVNRKQEFDSLLMLLSDTGGLVIQARMTSGEDRSFQAHTSLPLLTWIRLDCSFHDTEVKLETTWKNHSRTFSYRFPASIRYDDTDGYFLIGGSRYLAGIYGYFGPVVFYRLGTTRVENPLPAGNTLEKLDHAHRTCQQIRAFSHAFSRTVTRDHPVSTKGECHLDVRPWRRPQEPTCSQKWAWRTQRKFRTLFHFMLQREEDSSLGPWREKLLGDHLFEYVAKRMFSEDHARVTLSPSLRALLQASGCLGNQHATLLLATVNLAGLGHPIDREQGHVYSLMGALGDHRLALMHLGYKHSQGLDGFPRDLEVAYSCYANTATQTISDEDRVHENHQHMVEHVYLNNKEHLKAVDERRKDVVYFLKLKAESGDIQSQKQLASMSFWGQNGVPKDVATAVSWYRKIAKRMKDADAMYNYALLLMKGQGVKKNLTESVRLLEKAIEMGSVAALNAVGWYYSSVVRNASRAIQYFQRAALNGSRDAVYNLGLYHLSGEHPEDLHKNQTAAFQCFLNASRSGHSGASVGVAWYLATGALGDVARDVELAVRKLKKVSEKNGHLGYTLKNSLRAYLQESWAEALVGYFLTAEAGLGFAQTNSAHLCQELKFTPECQWRYTNYSVLNYDPHPTGLLKMGDYFYYRSARGGHGKDSLSLIGRAVSMYSRAASAGSPQGCFSLVLMAQEGHVLPLSVRRTFNTSDNQELDVLLENILQRCVEMEPAGTITPCSLALLRLWLDRAWRIMAQNPAKICLTYLALFSLMLVAVVMPTQALLDAVSRPSEGRRGRGVPGPEGTPYRTPWLWSGPGGPRTLWRTTEAVVSVSGALLCCYVTTVLSHML
ncbi:hypothetical protein NHX12_032929 [Muraenolepis orangiensis]|uniref:Uncharacterized protein n=1 Tax=Muraenolepis orangiensis TaxID=630683 RepID=A0A9Q0E454_9TELE|nr:hypothetical protein NHX12_032929 [Muraenolepis orangiensis]